MRETAIGFVGNGQLCILAIALAEDQSTKHCCLVFHKNGDFWEGTLHATSNRLYSQELINNSEIDPLENRLLTVAKTNGRPIGRPLALPKPAAGLSPRYAQP